VLTRAVRAAQPRNVTVVSVMLVFLLVRTLVVAGSAHTPASHTGRGQPAGWAGGGLVRNREAGWGGRA